MVQNKKFLLNLNKSYKIIKKGNDVLQFKKNLLDFSCTDLSDKNKVK